MPLSKSELARLIRESKARQASRLRVATVPRLLPDERTFLTQHVFWPHMETGEAVCDLNAMQTDYLDRSAAFRVDANGRMIGGADVWGKGRKVRASSLCLGRGLYWTLYFGLPAEIVPQRQTPPWAFRWATVMQVGREDIFAGLVDPWEFMLTLMPVEWVGDWVGEHRDTGHVYTFPGGGSWRLLSAGNSKRVAGNTARGGTYHLWHMTECRDYAWPEEVFAAGAKALPPDTGWIVAESTFPSDIQQGFAQWYHGTKAGGGKFDRCFFHPWHYDPLKRLSRSGGKFKRVMSAAFRKRMADTDPTAIKTEIDLGLDDEQVAYRRTEYCTGTPEARRLARRENPEDDMMPFESPDSPWFDVGASDSLVKQCAKHRALELVRPIIESMIVVIYQELPADEGLSLGFDPAEFGRDPNAGVGIAARSHRQVCEIHGKGLDSDIADTIVWTLRRFGVVTAEQDSPMSPLMVIQHVKPYTVGVERNMGKHLIMELAKRRVRLYHEPGQKSVGIWTTGPMRQIFWDHLAGAIEGSDVDENKRTRQLGPTIDIRSRYLADEIKHIVERDGRPDHAQGRHDDRCMALSFALHISPTIRMGSRWPTQRSTPDPRPVPIVRSGGPA